MEVPSREDLRRDLSTFDEVQKKAAGGMLAVMFASPGRIKDREWMSEQFTQVALLTGQFEEAEHAHEGIVVAQAWIQSNITSVLNACFALFVHVAEDMAGDRSGDRGERRGGQTFSASDAMIQALGYFDGA